MFTVFVYLYLFHYYGWGGPSCWNLFLFTTIIELYFFFLPYAQSWVLYFFFSFGVDIVFFIVAGKQDALHLDLRMSFLLFSFDQFNK